MTESDNPLLPLPFRYFLHQFASVLFPRWNRMSSELRLMGKQLMEQGAKSRRYIILLLVIFEEEIAYSMLVSSSKLIVNERFSEDRLATARIGRDPERVIVSLCEPLEILRVRQHPLTGASHSLRVDVSRKSG